MRSVDEPISRSLGERIYDKCIYPQGQHHEFSSGLHGRKLDLEVLQDSDPLYEELLDATAKKVEVITRGVPLGRVALIGVANGANRFVEPVASRLDGSVMKLFTDKSNESRVQLAAATILEISRQKPELALFLDDVGTTGSSVLQIMRQAKGLGSKRSEVLYAVSRKIILPDLEAARIPYYSVEDVHLDDFTPQECATNPDGYCSQGWELIERSR